MNHTAATILVAALDGVALSSDERNFFQKYPCSGVTLFRRNINSDFSTLKKLTNALQGLSQQGLPVIIAVDQEGGRVSRLGSPFCNLGAAASLCEGKADPESLVQLANYGLMVGSGLRSLGVNVNFAPVCDLNTNPKNPVIGDRAFAADPQLAAERAGAYLDGLQLSGVKGCLKHFPGQGAGSVDTHLGGDIIDADATLLEQRELVPFRVLVARAPLIMISHSIFTAYGREPASLSKVVMHDLLRGKLGFSGVVVSDDMNMKAINQDERSWQEAIVMAVSNGCDLILVCEHLQRCRLALEALASEAAKSPAFYKRLETAAARVAKLRQTLSS